MADPVQSRLHDAITSFARFFRQAGGEIGTGEILSAVEAVSYVDINNRDDFKSALRTSLITSHKLIPVFEQLFDLYWRNPDRLDNVSDILRKLYESRLAQAELKSYKDHLKELSQKRVEEFKERESDSKEGEEHKPYDVFLYSPEEVLREKRFDNYSSEELEDAREFINHWKWKFGDQRLRRLKPGKNPYRLNMRGTIRKNIFPTQDFIELKWCQRKTKPRPLVILCDISGSMESYTRLLLHFIFTLNSVHKHTEAFTFGTRLSRITHYLRQKNVNDALDLVTGSVKDWSGGTKIGETIESFNLLWSRRVLPGGAVVLIISDGWDTGNIELLKKEMDRLHRSCYKLIWLNPNLGYKDFQPLTQGIEAILPHVDNFLPIHNLNSLVELGEILAELNKPVLYRGFA